MYQLQGLFQEPVAKEMINNNFFCQRCVRLKQLNSQLYSQQITMFIAIRPIEAALIHDPDWFCRMDPYCKMYLGDIEQNTQICKNGGRNPRWSETLKFNTQDQNLKIQVWDHDAIGQDLLIGTGAVKLQKSMFQEGKCLWVDLRFLGRSAGRLCISVQFGIQGSYQIKHMNEGFVSVGINL